MECKLVGRCVCTLYKNIAISSIGYRRDRPYVPYDRVFSQNRPPLTSVFVGAKERMVTRGVQKSCRALPWLLLTGFEPARCKQWVLSPPP